MTPHQAASFAALRPRLWGLAYRMTGAVQEADEVVQEVALRLIERPPRREGPLEGWLITVGLHCARDRLRKRRRETYAGPWLPSPVATERLADESLALRQTATWGFLRAAEALSPTQRAVFLAREVLELSAAETAAALGSTPGAVDVALHAARKHLGAVPLRPRRRDDALLLAFLGALQVGQVELAAAMLRPDAVALNDGGGKVLAAQRPVVGAAKVLRFLGRLERGWPGGPRLRLARCNGQLALLGERRGPPAHLRQPTRFALLGEVHAGQISALCVVLAPDKLAHLWP